MLLRADMNFFSSVNQIQFTIKAGQLFSNCQHRLLQDHICSFVLTAHYNVSITSRQQRIFNQLPFLSKYYEVKFFQLQLVKIFCKLINM